MSTAYPLFFHYVIPSSIVLIFFWVIGLTISTSLKFSRNIASKRALSEFKAELSKLAGMQADLEDRFTRFQKREGMRAARQEKEGAKNLTREAQELLAANVQPPQPQGTSSKVDLYRRMRGLQ